MVSASSQRQRITVTGKDYVKISLQILTTYLKNLTTVVPSSLSGDGRLHAIKVLIRLH